MSSRRSEIQRPIESLPELEQESAPGIAPRSQLATILEVLRERWWVLLLLMVLLAAASTGRALLQDNRYAATALLEYKPGSESRALLGNPELSATTGRTDFQSDTVARQTLQQLGTTDRVRDEASAKIGRIDEDVTTELETGSNLLSVRAVSGDPRRAAKVATTWAQALVNLRAQDNRQSYVEALDLVERELAETTDPSRRRSLERQRANLRIVSALQQSDVQLAEQASVPDSAFSPQPVRAGALGALAGLVVGLALILTLHSLDRRLKRFEDVERAWGAPMLATLGESDPEAMLEDFQDPALGNALSHIHAALEFSPHRPKVVVVTSAIPGEGKSTAALGLALTLAAANKRVLLVDADFRRPTLTTVLGASGQNGLTDVIMGREPIQRCVIEVPLPGREEIDDHREVSFLGSGWPPTNSYEYLSSAAAAEVIQAARQEWDLVVIDSAPLLPVSDTIPVLKTSEGVLIATRLQYSRSDSSRRARNLIDRVGVPVLGVAVAAPSSTINASYGYGYGYGALRARRAPANGNGTVPSAGVETAERAN